jgi:effector-binding domain-containing protein
MLIEPKLEYRNKQHYVAIRTQAAMNELPAVIPQLLAEVNAWLDKQPVTRISAPFIRYNVIDMQAKLDIELGWALSTPIAGEGRIASGVLPAGQYAVVVYTGPYENLVEVTADLLAWAEQKKLAWKMSADGLTWGARLEFYLKGPESGLEPKKWQTELAFLVAEGQQARF